MQALSTVKNWILLRGLAREQQHWGEFYPQCQQHLPDHRFYCLDLPGCGEHYQRQSPLSISAIRITLQQQLQEKNISGPFGIIGLSLGAMVALEWLADERQPVAAVVIINTSSNDFPLHWRLSPAAVGLGLRALLPISIERRERLILQLVSQQRARDNTIAAHWLTIQQQRPVTRATIMRQLIAAARFSAPQFQSSKCGLILCSDSDRMVSYRCSLQLAHRYQWPLHCHINSGHDLPLDDPLWVVDKFKHWLYSNTSVAVANN